MERPQSQKAAHAHHVIDSGCQQTETSTQQRRASIPQRKEEIMKNGVPNFCEVSYFGELTEKVTEDYTTLILYCNYEF